ncbi:MAG TPA: NmrA family NAD(P)-binding protein [Streptosporangiaceae bacterium]|nr:NmrA family NAD(P)-binding protein [Streptosporangiaceae bacterium]
MRVLVTGATGRVGRAVVGSLTAAGVPVRALTRRPEAAALPANVEVAGRLAARTRRVAFLSSPHQTPHPFFQQPNPMAVLHADIERLIAAAGLELTIIRPGMFASNTLLWWAPAIRADGVVRWPYGAAETAPVDDRDVAGRRIRFEELSPEEFRTETAGTWPRPVVDMLLDAWAATMGRPAFVTTTVPDILGSARPFRQWAADHVTAFI